MLFGYARKSTESQKIDLQVDALLRYGVAQKNIYIDTGSGAKSDRENLDKLLSKLREGDTLVIWKLDRIAKSVRHLTQLVTDFKENEIDLVSIKEPFLDTTSSYGKFIFTIFSGIAELERDILIERTLAGQESARRRGVKIGRKKGLSKKAKEKAILAENYYRDESKQLSINEILKLTGIRSKKTLYSYLAIQGRRNCKYESCGKLFWDKDQELSNAYCKKHKNKLQF